MFKTARIKMTAWYVLIVMLVSLSFSWGMYLILRNEVLRFSQVQRFRIQRIIDSNTRPPDLLGSDDPLQVIRAPLQTQLEDTTLEEETLHRLQIDLVGLNLGILVMATGLCYLLAGKTLAPIETMVEEQQRFISDSSHELKTPLTAMRTASEVALRSPQLSLKEAKKVIRENIDEIAHLQELNDQLLKLDFSQRGNQEESFTVVPFHEVIQNVVKKMSPLAKQKEITLHSQLASVNVIGNATQLTEIGTILIDNAIKYSQSKIQVEVNLNPQKQMAVLQVIDHGAGIPSDQITHIFDRFYRGDPSRTKNLTAGYGLGLAIAQRLAELHHGKITVKSEVGTGSTFTFMLPVASV